MLITEQEFIERRRELQRSHDELLTVSADESEFIDEDGRTGYTMGSYLMLDAWASIPKELAMTVLKDDDNGEIPYKLPHRSAAVVGPFKFIYLDILCEINFCIEELEWDPNRNTSLAMKRIKEHYRHLSSMERRYSVIGVGGLIRVRRVVHDLFNAAMVNKLL